MKTRGIKQNIVIPDSPPPAAPVAPPKMEAVSASAPVVPPAGVDKEGQSVLPPQQTRSLAQLRSSMVSLNRKFGNVTTNELINQIINSLNLETEDLSVTNRNILISLSIRICPFLHFPRPTLSWLTERP